MSAPGPMAEGFNSSVSVSNVSSQVFNTSSSSSTPSLSSTRSSFPASCKHTQVSVLKNATSTAIGNRTTKGELASVSPVSSLSAPLPVITSIPTAVSASPPHTSKSGTVTSTHPGTSSAPSTSKSHVSSVSSAVLMASVTSHASVASPTHSSASTKSTASRPSNIDDQAPDAPVPSAEPTTPKTEPHTSSPAASSKSSTMHVSSTPEPAPPPPTSSSPPKVAPRPTKTPTTSIEQKPVINSQSSATHQQQSNTSGVVPSTSKTSSSSDVSSSKGGSTDAPKSSESKAPVSSGSHSDSAKVTPAISSHNGATPQTTLSFLPHTETIGGAEGAVNSDTTPSATLPVQSTSQPGGFFADNGKVAGVFVTVSLVSLAILALIPWLLRRYRRRRRESRAASRSYYRRPSMSQIEPPFEDLHYRRQSQILAFSNHLSQGAGTGGRSRPGTGGASDDSHHVSTDTHHSSEPIVGRFVTPLSRTFGSGNNASKTREGFTNGYATVIPYPETRTPLATLPELPGLPQRQSEPPAQERLPRIPPVSHSLYPDFINAAIVERESRNSAISANTTSNAPPLPPKSPARRASKALSRPILMPEPPLPIAHPQSYSPLDYDDAPLRPPNPFISGKEREASIAETSPSIYPPSLPREHPDSDSESEESYWRSRGFEDVFDIPTSSSSSSKPSESVATPGPDPHRASHSSLGLKLGPASNSSQSTIKGIVVSLEEENEMVRNMDPKMEASGVHRGSTAPIRMPSAWNLRGEGRYPLLGQVPNKKAS